MVIGLFNPFHVLTMQDDEQLTLSQFTFSTATIR